MIARCFCFVFKNRIIEEAIAESWIWFLGIRRDRSTKLSPIVSPAVLFSLDVGSSHLHTSMYEGGSIRGSPWAVNLLE